MKRKNKHIIHIKASVLSKINIVKSPFDGKVRRQGALHLSGLKGLTNVNFPVFRRLKDKCTINHMCVEV
jgi:hypothetical protein